MQFFISYHEWKKMNACMVMEIIRHVASYYQDFIIIIRLFNDERYMGNSDIALYGIIFTYEYIVSYWILFLTMI